MAQVQSSASLKLVQYDVFIKVIPISRHTETMVESKILMATMSIFEPSLMPSPSLFECPSCRWRAGG